MSRLSRFSPVLLLVVAGCASWPLSDIISDTGAEVSEHGGDVITQLPGVGMGSPAAIIAAVGAVVAIVSGVLTRYFVRKKAAK